ncbi:MAG: hypothetical protein HDR72_02430 [Ruminococcaceae bacterium]|nr:hypothetical protein [Oscillospiraceae bacterium]
MSDEFKKFIDTGGKTLDEIRKTIERMLNNTVDSVVDEAAKLVPKDIRDQIKQAVKDVRKSPDGYYKPEKIPPRSSLPSRPQSGTAGREPIRAAYPREYVPEHMSPQDELMLDKIGEMRGLEETSDNRYITGRCVEVTMVKQGLFMADVEDDFNRRVFCALQQPVYMAMSNSQLRTYFTWRTDVRRGKYPEIDKPYVLLYCYELLNKIGVSSAAEAFGRLLDLWEGCRPFAGYLNEIMPRWLKDFYVYNDVTSLYPDISQYLGASGGSSRNRCMEEFENGNYEGKLDYLAEYSAYNIKGSIFLSDKTRPPIDGACAAALKALSEYFTERGIDMVELLCGKVRKDYSWVPFRGAVVDLERTDGFRPLRLGAAERYCIKRGEPSLEVFDFSPSRGFIGYLLKSVEAELRRRTKFKRYIIPNIVMLENDFRNREKLMSAVTDERFEKLIPSAVAEYCRQHGISAPEKKASKTEERSEYVREKVEIDVSKLGRIREQSDELAKKLIVEEIPTPREDEIEEMSMMIADDDFSERVADCTELSPEEPEIVPVERNTAFSELPDEWQDFANDLTPTHLAVLKRMQNGSAAEYCRQNGLMPETVCEEINTAALETILDVVIEGGEILSDYSAEIAKIVEAAGI